MPAVDYDKMKADLLDELSQKFAAPTMPDYVPPTVVDPAIAKRAMDDSAKVDMVHGALGAAPLTAYGARLGQRAGQVGPSPLADAVKEQAMQPLQLEQQRVANQNALAAGSNKYALASAGLGVKQQLGQMAMDRSLLGSFISATAKQGAAETGATSRETVGAGHDRARVESARVTATAPKIGFNPVTGQPLNLHATVGSNGAQADGASAGGASASGDVATRGAADSPDLASWAQKAPAEDPNDKRLPKLLTALGNDLNQNKARAGEMKANQARINAANRLLALARGPDGKIQNLNPQQMTELSTSLGGVIGGGSSSDRIAHELTPYTKGRSLAEIGQWLSDQPQGADQQAFVKQMAETADREKGVAQKGVSEAQQQLLGLHTPLMQLFPRAAAAALNGFGIDPANVDAKTGAYRPKAAGGRKVDPAALEQRARARLGIDPDDKWATDVLNALGKK